MTKLIAVVEPQYWPQGDYSQDEIWLDVPLTFTDALKRPVKFERPYQEDFGYIFGALHPVDEYRFVARLGQDNGQIGIIDYDQLVERARKRGRDVDAMLKNQKVEVNNFYEKHRFVYDDPLLLKKLQKNFPWLVMVGSASDFGTKVWTHLDADDQVDGLVFRTPPPGEEEGDDHLSETQLRAAKLAMPFEVKASRARRDGSEGGR